MNNILIILGILMIAFGTLIGVSLSSTEETREVLVDCFDKYGSLINGLQCTETQHSYWGLKYNSLILLPFFMLMTMSLVIGVVFLIFGIMIPPFDAKGRKHDG